MWQRLSYQNFDTTLQRTNISFTMGTGFYHLGIGKTQRISSAILCGDDLGDLITNKIYAQNIYNNNYKFEEASHEIPVSITFPLEKDTVKGVTNINWNTGEYLNQEAIVQIFLASDGEDFEKIDEVMNSSGSYQFNTENYSDGVLYKLRILCTDGIRSGYNETTGYFIINNPGNGLPQLKILNPKPGNVVKNETEIKFVGGDPDGETSTISFYLGTSPNDNNLIPIAEYLSDNTTQFMWNTLDIANGTEYYLFGKIQNNNNTEIVTAGPFSIENIQNVLNGRELILSKDAKGTGNFYLRLVDSQNCKANDYRVEFVELSDSQKTGYDLFDITNSQYIYQNEKLDIYSEGPLFNGCRLTIADDAQQSIIDSLTGWDVGNSNLNMQVTVDQSAPARNMYWEEDFMLNFKESNVYTTPFFQLPCNILMNTIDDNTSVDYELFDNDDNNSLSINDYLVLIHFDQNNKYWLTWRVDFKEPLNTNEEGVFPIAGDVFKIISHKTFKPGDQITFSTETIVGVEDNDMVYNFSLSQNYPNPFNPTTTIKFSIPHSQFATLKVYDILGQEVKTLLNKPMQPGNYEIEFNGSNLPSGVYFYRLTAGSIVQTKKMLLLK